MTKIDNIKHNIYTTCIHQQQARAGLGPGPGWGPKKRIGKSHEQIRIFHVLVPKLAFWCDFMIVRYYIWATPTAAGPSDDRSFGRPVKEVGKQTCRSADWSQWSDINLKWSKIDLKICQNLFLERKTISPKSIGQQSKMLKNRFTNQSKSVLGAMLAQDGTSLEHPWSHLGLT